jgi:competence protein ComEC
VILIFLCCAWIIGILLGNTLEIPLIWSLLGLIPLPLLLVFRKNRKQVVFASLGICLLVTGATYSYTSLHDIDGSQLRFYNDSGNVVIRGVVTSDPEIRDKTTRLNLKATAIKLDDGWHNISGQALVFVPRYPAYSYGDQLEISGIMETPPLLRDFDYKGYLAHQGIYTTVYFPQIEVTDSRQGFPPLAWIYSLRSRLSSNLSQLLPEPQASLAQGIILGIRSNIPDSLSADFSRSGTAHVLAISGLHLSILAGILLSISIWIFGRRHHIYIWLTLSILWFYVMLTGMHPPAIRGAIMASIFLAAELFGRQRNSIAALILAAAIMVGINPYILGDASFQLSFLAMTGLIFFTPALQNTGKRLITATLGEEGTVVSLAGIFIDILSATFGAMIAVWPVIAYYFGIFSLVGPLATLLVLPIIPAAIVTGSLAAVTGLLLMPVAWLISWLAWFSLSYIMLVVNGLANLPLSALEFSSFSPVLIWSYYAALAVVIWLCHYRKRLLPLLPKLTSFPRPEVKMHFSLPGKIPLMIILPLLAIGAAYTAATMPDDNLHVTFLDVGEGDAILIQKGTQQILVDGGPSPQAVNLCLSEHIPFWDRTIELMVLTHSHADHLTGLVAAAQNYKVEQVLSPREDYDSPLYQEWQSLIMTNDIKLTKAVAGQTIDLDEGTVLEVLNPQSDRITGTASDVDNNSVVLRLTFGDISFLLTGDIMEESERALIYGRADLGCTLLKVAHHSSDTSSCPEFLSVTNPQVAVISAGEGNKFGHPNPEVLNRLNSLVNSDYIYRTDEDGTIEFVTDGKRLWVKMH